MRNVYRVLAYLLSIEVLVQGMAIAYGIAGLTRWVDDDGGVLNKQVLDSDDADFPGVGGFMIHGINGTTIIPLIVLLLLIVSFFAKVPGGIKRAAILFGLVVLQIFLGIFSHEIPFVVVFHVLNAFAIFIGAFMTGRAASTVAPPADATVAA
jgi:hypothetical protein